MHQFIRFMKLFFYSALMIGAVTVLIVYLSEAALQLQAFLGLGFLLPAYLNWAPTFTIALTRAEDRNLVLLREEITTLVDSVCFRKANPLFADFQVDLEERMNFFGHSGARLRFIYDHNREYWRSPFLFPIEGVQRMKVEIERFLQQREKDEIVIRWGRGADVQPQTRRLWLLCGLPVGVFFLATAILRVTLLPL